MFFLETFALKVINAFLTVLIEIYKIISKKALVANDDQENGNSALLTGTKLAIGSVILF